MNIKRKLKITGMDCSACVIEVDGRLEDIEGVASSKTSYAKQVVEVEFDPEKVNVATLIKTVKDLGYTAMPQD